MNTQDKTASVDNSRSISKTGKFLFLSFIVAMLLPGLALATAYNDVSIPSSTSLSVNGITINVTGATLQQLQVDTTTFNVTLAPNSAVTVTAPNLNKMTLSSRGSDFIASNQCDGDRSFITLNSPASAATTIITITPSSTICVTGVGGGGTAGTGGGGAPVGLIGSSGGKAPTAITPTAASAGDKQAQTAQLTAQLNTLLAQIAALKSGATPSASAVANANVNASFKRDLRVGSTGEDAKALQAYLNGHGFTVASSGAGSPGNETKRFGGLTRAALAKFQKSVGITPAYGYFGPKTRAYIASHP